jgi:hypothetical protein
VPIARMFEQPDVCVYSAAEGYALVDLYNNGSLDCRYATYGWKAGGA